MANLPNRSASQDDIVRAGVAAFALLALTVVHHVYGAIAFATPWRLHILAVVMPAAIVIGLALRRVVRATDRSAGRFMIVLAAIVILLVPVAAIGFYEGGYNHVFKNLLYFSVGEARTHVIFPPPLYEMPRDFFFEVTGIAQFPLSIATTVLTLRLLWRPVE